jgi:hypothetical protein
VTDCNATPRASKRRELCEFGSIRDQCEPAIELNLSGEGRIGVQAPRLGVQPPTAMDPLSKLE